ncbi:alpha/beta hydrolase [Fluviicola sp.]|jgi:pimeloyl-ACP methyl ester carboxylesterase|uniref:alpha/beta fold hydrolase n=1 Tax=Fluviicola sp. TaxID=1917219 RepID=UPI0028207176|nr:alpha/beta hydrolase [Fluviicola sp.]MDR0801583.1 alpha/beta hydrolase [Fluviicola sp.]
MKKVIILHGALGSKVQFGELARLLGAHFTVHVFDFDGHGSKSGSDVKYSIELFARNLYDFMRENQIEKPLIFAYSMGGFVALKLESMCPGSWEQLVTLGTKFDWTPESAEKETKMLNAEKIEEKVPAFAAYLKSLHGEHEWKKVLERTVGMMLEMGNEPVLTATDFSKIQAPVQLLRGSGDAMVSEEETKKIQKQLSSSAYREVSGWQHPINLISPEELTQQLLSLYLPG